MTLAPAIMRAGFLIILLLGSLARAQAPALPPLPAPPIAVTVWIQPQALEAWTNLVVVRFSLPAAPGPMPPNYSVPEIYRRLTDPIFAHYERSWEKWRAEENVSALGERIKLLDPGKLAQLEAFLNRLLTEAAPQTIQISTNQWGHNPYITTNGIPGPPVSGIATNQWERRS